MQEEDARTGHFGQGLFQAECWKGKRETGLVRIDVGL